MFSKLKSIWNNKYVKNTLLIFIPLLLCEIIFFGVGDATYGLYNMSRIILGLGIISLTLSIIISLFKQPVSYVIIAVFNFIASLYAFLQLGFKSFLGVYISINTRSQLGAVIDYVKDFLRSFKFSYYLVFIPFLLLIVYLIVFDKKTRINQSKKSIFTFKTKKKKEKEQKEKEITAWKSNVTMIGMIIILIILYYGTVSIGFMQNKLQLISNKELLKYPSNPSIAINQFGVLSYGILDIKSSLFPSQTQTQDIAYAKIDNEQTDYSRNIDDSKWQEITENEENPDYKNLNNYFISQKITDKNEYTGMFEDKNLIVIMMESVNDIFINEEYFPNFYNLYSNGWHWENNYSPRNSCSTGNNEMSGMIGLYSIYDKCTANEYRNNTYFESIFNLFNKAGYQTTSMHDYTEHYYYRNTIHTNMGSGKYYGVDDLGIDYRNEYRNWASDEDFMTQVLNILNDYSNEEHFMTWLTTVSSHQPYGVSSIQGDMYLDEFSNTTYPEDLQRYLSKLKILDNALGILIDGLEKQGKLDDTVIVLYGDHYPYGLKSDVINQILDYDVSVDFETERVPFVIYNNQMEAKTFKDYTSYVNIVPTIANLFNLDYDPRLYVGTDLLSKDYESLVVFADGSWRDKNVLYDASSGEVKYYTDKTYTDEKIMDITSEVSLKMQMSQLAITTNYFNYLDEKLNSSNEVTE